MNRTAIIATPNPFPALQQQLVQAVKIDGGYSYEHSLTATEVVLALSLLCVLAINVLRYRRGTLLFHERVVINRRNVFKPVAVTNYLFWYSVFAIRKYQLIRGVGKHC